MFVKKLMLYVIIFSFFFVPAWTQMPPAKVSRKRQMSNVPSFHARAAPKATGMKVAVKDQGRNTPHQ